MTAPTATSNRHCENCPSTCASCDSATTCQACTSGNFLDTDGMCKALKTCASDGYVSTEATCADEACTYYSNDNTCTKCATAENCGIGTFLDGMCGGGLSTAHPTCEACPQACDECSDAETCTVPTTRTSDDGMWQVQEE